AEPPQHPLRPGARRQTGVPAFAERLRNRPPARCRRPPGDAPAGGRHRPRSRRPAPVPRRSCPAGALKNGGEVGTLEGPEQRIVLHNVTWDTYECLLRNFENGSAPHLTYDRG